VVQLGIDGAGRAEQPEHLVDQVATQVAEQPGIGADLQRGRVVLVHPGLDDPELAELTALQHRGEGPDVGVPAAVVEHVQRNARGLRRRNEGSPGVRGRRERLVGDRRHAGGDGLQDELAPGLRRCSDRDRVDPGGQQIGQRVVGGHVGEVGGQLGAPPRRARNYTGQLDVLCLSYEGGVEVPATEPVPDQSKPHVSSRVRRRTATASAAAT
jgi:hypothetical protein